MGQGLGCLLTLAPTHLSTDPHTTPNNPSCAPVREAQAQDGLGPQMRHPPRDFGDHARPHPSHDPRPLSPPLGAGQNAPAEPLFHLNAVLRLPQAQDGRPGLSRLKMRETRPPFGVRLAYSTYLTASIPQTHSPTPHTSNMTTFVTWI